MPTPIEIYRELLEKNNPDIYDYRSGEHNAKEYYNRGETPPDLLLPGGAIRALTPEKREILSKLTSEEAMKERPMGL
jgi:hypothetical protein